MKRESRKVGLAGFRSELLAEANTAAIEKVCSDACRKKYKPSAAVKKANRSAVDQSKRMFFGTDDDENERW